MKACQVYRIHAKDTVFAGMYRSSDICPCSPDINSYDRHPTPSHDDGLSEEWQKLCDNGKSDEFLFAFGSKAQLKSWVYKAKWKKDLHDRGFVVSKIKSSYYFKGDTQAIFHSEEFEIIEEISILDL